MNAFLSISAALFASGDAAPTAPPGSGMFNVVVMVFIVLIGMFFIFILPRRAQEKQAKRLIDSLKVNDKVMTTSGMIGTIYSIDKEGGEVVLKVDETNGVKIRFAVGAIYVVYNKESSDASKNKDAKEKGSKK